MKILGVDCWNVIYQTPTGIPLWGAIEGLRKLAASGQFEQIYIVSKVDIISEKLTLFNFRARNFWRKTGIKRSNIFFCRQYEDKSPIAEKLGITHFIDDRLEVLSYMYTVPNLYALDPKKSQLKKYPEVVSKVTIVKSWEEMLALLLN